MVDRKEKGKGIATVKLELTRSGTGNLRLVAKVILLRQSEFCNSFNTGHKKWLKLCKLGFRVRLSNKIATRVEMVGRLGLWFTGGML